MLAGRSSRTKKNSCFCKRRNFWHESVKLFRAGPWPNTKQNTIYCKCANAHGACACAGSICTDRQDGHSGAGAETEITGDCTNSLPIQSNKGFSPALRKQYRLSRPIYRKVKVTLEQATKAQRGVDV